jgi:hypothetical protein
MVAGEADEAALVQQLLWQMPAAVRSGVALGGGRGICSVPRHARQGRRAVWLQGRP